MVLLSLCRRYVFVTLVPRWGGGFEAPSIFGTGRNFLCGFHWSVGRPNWTSIMYSWWQYPYRKSRWRPYTGSRSQLLYKVATETSKQNRHFCSRRLQRDSCSYCAMSAWVVNRRWPPLTGSRCDIMQNLSFYFRWRQNSKGNTHIFGVQQHGRTSMDTLQP